MEGATPDTPPAGAGTGTTHGRIADGRRHAEAAAELAREQVEAARVRFPLVRRGFEVADLDSRRLGNLLAGALAYRLFFWLLPFALFLLGLLGAITSLDGGAAASVTGSLDVHGTVAHGIQAGAQQRGWWIAVLVGGSGTLWAGMSATKAMRLVHAAAWGMPRPRPLPVVRATLGFATAAVAILGITALAGWLREADRVLGFVATLLIVLVYFAAWMAISSRLPHRPGHWTQLVPGALLVAAGAQGLHLFTAWYLVGRAERASSTYGAIGAALVILLWLFVVARLIVLAAVLNAELAGADEPHGEDDGGWRPRG